MYASATIQRTLATATLTIVLAGASVAPPPAAAAEAVTLPSVGVGERVEARLAEAGLPDELRAQMRQNLQRILELDLDPAQVEALFPGARPGRGPAPEVMLRWQQRVLAAAQDGLPADALLDKLCEGRRKGADPQRLEHAFGRMEQHARAAQRALQTAHAQGVAAQEDPGSERALLRGLALGLWRGLDEEELAQLVGGCAGRAGSGKCTTLELCAAAETAVQLRENGVEPARATGLAKAGLERGYSARDLRRLAHLVAAGRLHGDHVEEVLEALEDGVRQHADLDEMQRRMLQWRWMGPAEGRGHGGGSPVDDVLGGGPGTHQGGRGGAGGPGGLGQGRQR